MAAPSITTLPAPFMQIVGAGVLAYGRFLEAVQDERALAAYRAEQPQAEGLIAQLAGLPPADAALPLRVLVRIAHQARSGRLEWTYLLESNAAAGFPLTEWYDRYRAVLEGLVPEARVDVPWTWLQPSSADPADPGRVDWPTLLAASEAFAVESESQAGWETIAQYVLLRDWAFDLAPLLAELEVELDSLLLTLLEVAATADYPGESPGAFPTDPVRDEPALRDALSAEQLIRGEFGLPTNAWTIFGALAADLDAKPAIRRLLIRSGDYRPGSRITSDLSVARAQDDALNYRVYVDAIVQCVLDPRTRPPLTIGIKARWGIGKTSLMRMVHERLAADEPERPEGKESRGSVLSFLHALARAPDEKRNEVLRDWIGPVGKSRRVTVWFNAWKYQSSEQVWAGLAHAIVTSAEAAMDPRQRTLFRLARETHRVNFTELRRRILSATVVRVLPIGAVAAAIALAAAVAYSVAPAGNWLHRGSLWGFVSAAVIGGVGGLGRALKFLNVDFSRADAELVDDPGYERRLGFLHTVEADVQQVLAVCASEQRPLVVFIDDLDRCRYQTVAEVIEAVNAFLAGDYRQCIFVIAMEPNVVAAHIELAYERLAAALAEDGSDRRFGWHFLEKMVQLPLSLPPPEKGQMRSYLDVILTEEADGTPAAVDTEALRERIRSRVDEQQPRVGSLAEAGKAIARDEAAGDPLVEAEAASVAMEYAADKLDERHPLTRQVVAQFADLLDTNPRELKRYVNVFRFYALIQIGREVLDQPAPTFLGTGKVALLAVRWPHLLGVLGREIEYQGETVKVLTFLEWAARAGGTDDEMWRTFLSVTGASPAVQAELRSPILRAALARDPLVGDDAVAFL